MRRRLGTGVLAVILFSYLLNVGGSQLADAAVTWNVINTVLPSNAVASEGVTLASSSCPVDGWCVGVGNYAAGTSKSFYVAGLIVTTFGNGSDAIEAPLPDNASATDPQTLLQSVTCTSIGSCVAVGQYVDTSDATQALIETLSNDMWTPTEVTLPQGADSSGPGAYAQLSTVTCPSASWCEGLGEYTDSILGEQAFSVTLGSGVWTSTATPLAAGAQGSQFSSLSCPQAGACVATGSYLEGYTYVGMIETLSNVTWTAITAPLPPGTPADAEITSNDMFVSCAEVGACTVAGTYFDDSFSGFVDTLSAGSWSSVSAPTPGSPSTDLQLDSLSCADPTSCVAVGLVTSSSNLEEGLIETLSDGTWNAIDAPVPTGESAEANVELSDINCPSADTCVADGESDVGGVVTGVFWNLSDGSWVVSPAPLPTDAAADPDPAFAPITCPAVGACLAMGTYVSGTGRTGLIETDPSLQASSTTVMMQPSTSSQVLYSANITAPGRMSPGRSNSHRGPSISVRRLSPMTAPPVRRLSDHRGRSWAPIPAATCWHLRGGRLQTQWHRPRWLPWRAPHRR